MASYPPIDRSYVVSYAANDRDHPIIGIKRDPRTSGYKVPEDLSPHPDSKRYPNHVFTGAQPSSGDQVVTHIYEILPAPWVPFTRYDDDLGPIQGRRRSVKNEGQIASLAADKRVTYEAREGSAIVYTEIEETWSIAVDEDGNSLFPVRDRDFYDPSRGPVQERRQLFVPTGEEEGSLENINGVITQTSYEPYNEFLSVKIVQTYSVSGPQLIGKATNEEGQLVTITTQRKGSKDYIPPNPTALRTVEASREDAESLVERIIDTPKVFANTALSIERPDNVPPKFKAKIPVRTTQSSVAGVAQSPSLSSGEFAKSEQQVTEFIKRTSVTSRSLSTPQTLTGLQYTTEFGGGYAVVTETYPVSSQEESEIDAPEFGTISDEIENLGDGSKIRRTVKLDPQDITIDEFDDSGNPITVPSMPVLVGQEYDEELDIVIPFKQLVSSPSTSQLVTGERRRVTPRDVAHSVVVRYDIEDVQQALDDYYWETPTMVGISLPDKLLSVSVIWGGNLQEGQQNQLSGDTYLRTISSGNSRTGQVIYDIESGFNGNIPAIKATFFLPKENSNPNDVLQVLSQKNLTSQFIPNPRPQSHEIVVFGGDISTNDTKSVSFDSVADTTSKNTSISVNSRTIPPTIHGDIDIEYIYGNGELSFNDGPPFFIRPTELAATEIASFPTGKFLYQINSSPYRFGYVKIEAVVVDILESYV